MEKRIEQIMKSLECSRAEALQVIADDRKIDKGEKLFELSKEQQRVSKESRAVARKPTVYKFEQKKSRKSDNEKKELMEMIEKMLEPVARDFELLNPERECTFFYNDRKFKITLSAPRK